MWFCHGISNYCISVIYVQKRIKKQRKGKKKTIQRNSRTLYNEYKQQFYVGSAQESACGSQIWLCIRIIGKSCETVCWAPPPEFWFSRLNGAQPFVSITSFSMMLVLNQLAWGLCFGNYRYRERLLSSKSKTPVIKFQLCHGTTWGKSLGFIIWKMAIILVTKQVMRIIWKNVCLLISFYRKS